ncbi:platelet-derived growth factor receptor-like protein isoform X2 [Dunckerocampus dactyliophorus]|uniref:platelet-derived growth factor receptor-like protein isoform X2 n=1 Tax=Dunckerocampus dactyliophorus TaxID=161453 RepID=UPI00240739F4|nr:platelet-derived growth factor receptor-like protein isoform X2 [Dunckerocampus dactyliophorus]
MKLCVVLCLALFWMELQHGACQQANKRRKDAGENRIRPGGKRGKMRHPKLKEGGGRGHTLLTQVLEKGRFLRLGQSTILTPGNNLELRCKGSKIDKDNLFVPSDIHFQIVYLRPDKPAVVPCRVTTPHATVSLHREVPPKEIAANGTAVTYDPTKGFVLQTPSLEYQGVFYCKAVAKGTPQISNKYQLLYVEVPSSPPFVSLKASSELASGGDNINVTCSVMGEPDVDVSFTWSYPGQGQRPVHIQTSWRLVNRGRVQTTRLTQSVLSVEDMETIDFGKYICKAKNQHGETLVTTSIMPK